MAKQDRAKAKSASSQPTKEENKSQETSKMPAEQGLGERIHDRLVFHPRVDIYETNTGLTLLADMPGVTSDGLEITLENRVLTIYGRVEEEAPEGFSPIHREYEIGDFERQFTLAGDFDTEGIEAELREGVLHLAIPRAPKPQAKRIEVKSSS